MKFIIPTLIIIAFLIGFSSEVLMHFFLSIGQPATWSYIIPNILIVVVLGTLLFFTIKSKIKLAYKSIIVIVTIGGAMGVNFLMNPLYPVDIENRNVSIDYSTEEFQQLNKISDKKIKCFFLSSCPYCEIAAHKLNLMYNSGSIQDIEFIYYSYQKTADSIVKSQNIKVPYSNYESDSIFTLVGNSFPVILLQNNDTSLLWAGNDVNFACFDFLQKIN
jgi:hypothetical protein